METYLQGQQLKSLADQHSEKQDGFCSVPSGEASRLGNVKSPVPGFLHLFYTLCVQIPPQSYSDFFQGFVGVKENIRGLQAMTQ